MKEGRPRKRRKQEERSGLHATEVQKKERTHQSTVSTITCLRQGNINKLTQKTDRELRKKKKAMKKRTDSSRQR